MPIHEKDPLAPNDAEVTPQDMFLSRRQWLSRTGFTAGGLGLAGYGAYWLMTEGVEDDAVLMAGRSRLHQAREIKRCFPADRDPRFQYGRPETAQGKAARFTNFYEFSRYKSCWRYVDLFKPYPWRIQVTGLCRNPIDLDLDQFFSRYRSLMRERQYRHRCVERWAMAVPWTGIALNELLKDADPLASATHVRFVSFNRPLEAANQESGSRYPWPYVEGLRLDEALHDLTFLATGVYGEPLLKQHGAPLRLVVPWKYGYKSPKSIQRIEFTDKQPDTFWTTLNPAAYPFESNVDPKIARPGPQDEERMLGTDEVYRTKYLNGYQPLVGHLYS